MTKNPPHPSGQFCWADLASHGASSARKFYAAVFHWTTEVIDTGSGPRYAHFLSEGECVTGLGELNQEMRDQGVPPIWNSYVAVEDIEAVLAEVEGLGGTVTVPAMRARDAGSLAFILDPSGGHVGLWQVGEHLGASRMHEAGSVCWNELATRDVDRAAKFYGELFGWTFREREGAGRYLIIENQGEGIGGILEMTPDYGELPPHWMVYFQVAAIDASCAAVLAAGGQVHLSPYDSPLGRTAVVSDAQGAAFSLVVRNQG